MTSLKVRTKGDCILENVRSLCFFINSMALGMMQFLQAMVRKVSMTKLRDQLSLFHSV